MRRTFFARYGLLVLMAVMFLVPFALRGARYSVQQIKNDIKDWLPSDFEETQELVWFARHFAGEQFVIVTWPGCTEHDPRFKMFVEKLRGEVAPSAAVIAATEAQEKKAQEQKVGEQAVDDQQAEPPPDPAQVADKAEENADAAEEPDEGAKLAAEVVKPLTETEALIHRARTLGDKLGLFSVGDYHQNWGGKEEKWLAGADDQWYYVTPDGDLYRWSSNNHLPGFMMRQFERWFTGKNELVGERIATFGEPSTPGKKNIFYADPRKLTARFFKTVRTGPQILDELSEPNGPLWPRTGYAGMTDDEKREIAREWAYERLTGSLFGPQPPADFDWSASAFLEVIGPEEQKKLSADWKQQFQEFVAKHPDLHEAKTTARVRNWFALCNELGVTPPAPQTAVMVTISEVGKRNLQRIVGRPLMGKPSGKLLQMAIGECNVAADDLKMGGPPVDNVAIDEEGTVTLVNLISYSALIGFVLAYISFRSLKVTMMVFFVGGVSAITSLSLVWWSSVIWPDSPYGTVDAILLSMPSLIYVLGLSGAVHIVNYYREEAQQHGAAGAPERALAHAWWPCTLAAFTTALGLISLCTSNILPIRKFGLFSAVGTMATLALLFTFLPAALQVWSPGYDRSREGEDGRRSAPAGGRLHAWVVAFWDRVGRWVVNRHWWVATGCAALMIVFAVGLLKINTSVQLLKLFDKDAKIIQDYQWLETHLGQLVPMELIVKVEPQAMLPTTSERAAADSSGASDAAQERFQYNVLERLEISERVGREVERHFGEEGTGVVGRGLRAGTFLEDLPASGAFSVTSTESIKRTTFNGKLEQSRDQLLASDYVRLDKQDGSELWRISLRLGALNNVDYGQFVGELKRVVEPVMAGYRYRDRILHVVNDAHNDTGFSKGTVLLLGAPNPKQAEAAKATEDAQNAAATKNAASSDVAAEKPGNPSDQTQIFARTLDDLLSTAGARIVAWHDPDPEDPEKRFQANDAYADALSKFDCVVVVTPHESYDAAFISKHAKHVIDATDHRFDPASGMPTAAQRDGSTVSCVYTGVVPIVYKAQRTLLESLVNSIALAFVMIAVVMMFLLRNGKLGLLNFMNPAAGLASMLPNVFPIVIIFGAMGFLGVLVDIGTMMTASVAMGIAVDDTIHFLTWFRQGISEGLTRKQAICKAYGHVATAMTQTTLIGGLGLSVFALSTFTPTQGFGVMMLCLLAMALVGDLIFLPALLASPLGWFFETRRGATEPDLKPPPRIDDEPPSRGETPHSSARAQSPSAYTRRDDGHKRLGH